MTNHHLEPTDQQLADAATNKTYSLDDFSPPPSVPRFAPEKIRGFRQHTSGILVSERALRSLVESPKTNGVEYQVEVEDPELTAEQQKFREQLLQSVPAAYAAYRQTIAIINRNSDPSPDHDFGTVAESFALELAQQSLTPTLIRDLHTQLEKAKANKIENSPTPGFNLLFIPNRNLTTAAEDNLASVIQVQVPAYDGDPYVYEPIHNTPHQHNPTNDSPVTIAFAPRHYNLPAGKASTQKAAMDAHNVNPENATTLRSATDLEAMTAIFQTITANPDNIDWQTKEGWNSDRFHATYFRNVTATPDADGDVPDVYVDYDGQFNRGDSPVGNGYAGRALVVPKSLKA